MNDENKLYKIEFLDCYSDISRLMKLVDFRLEDDSIFGIGVTHLLYWGVWQLKEEEQIKDVLPRIALRKLLEILTRNEQELHRQKNHYYEYVFTTDNSSDNLEDYLSLDCEFQAVEGRSMICVAGTNDKTKGRTTTNVCKKCALPRRWELCSNIINVETIDASTLDGPDRLLANVDCDAGNQVDINNVGGCRPGGRACWTLYLAIQGTKKKFPVGFQTK